MKLVALIAVLGLSGCTTTVSINYKANQNSDKSEINQSTEAVVTPLAQ